MLTGRHGLFNCYEAFIHIVDSMFNQHAKWAEGHVRTCRGGGKIALAELTCWPRMSGARITTASPHQDPGFIDHVVNKGGDRAGLSAAGCQLPAVGDGPLPAQPPLRQCRDRRQAPGGRSG